MADDEEKKSVLAYMEGRDSVGWMHGIVAHPLAGSSPPLPLQHFR